MQQSEYVLSYWTTTTEIVKPIMKCFLLSGQLFARSAGPSNSYYIVQVIANVIEPYFMNPDELNWKGYTGFFWFGSAFFTLVWAFFRLPETKGRTYEELDLMFAAKVPTRKFSKYHVDAYDESRNLTDRMEEHE
ncbi:hypothetical protein LTS15_010099 [Exophiala xenobiotica]|nr:hypothetical protein LTS15_010099 [Exophiala xenobiotica]